MISRTVRLAIPECLKALQQTPSYDTRKMPRFSPNHNLSLVVPTPLALSRKVQLIKEPTGIHDKKEETYGVDWYLRKGCYLHSEKKEPPLLPSFGQKYKKGSTDSSVPGLRIAFFTGCALKVLLASRPLISSLVGGASMVLLQDRLVKQNQIKQVRGCIEGIESFPDIEPAFNTCSSIATENSADTERWRERLIQSAEHNIILSGNYCAGNDFVKFLSLIRKRIEEKPDLKVIIIADTSLIKDGWDSLLKEMTALYPQNFSFVGSHSHWVGFDEVKRATNHTKCMVIDYGKYFILGGSGIKDNFTGTGLDSLSKEEYLSGKKDLQKEVIEKSSSLYIDKFLPPEWRDSDYVFCNSQTNNSGKQVYKQALLLALKYDKRLEGVNLHAAELGVFTGQISLDPVSPDDSVTLQLLKTKIPENISTRVPDFDENKKKSTGSQFKLICNESKMAVSPFCEEVISEINKAKQEIVINHMYFHPNEKVLDALASAANRGVKIKIITNRAYESITEGSPVQYGHAARGKASYEKLLFLTQESARNNLSYFSFAEKKSGLHKKTIVFDQEVVISGSSNLGSKSLNWSCDDEMNFIVRDPLLAKAVEEINAVDIEHSIEQQGPFELYFMQRVAACVHKQFAWFWG
jgi:HKD family nuclease